jgi:hypothetical protein
MKVKFGFSKDPSSGIFDWTFESVVTMKQCPCCQDDQLLGPRILSNWDVHHPERGTTRPNSEGGGYYPVPQLVK